METHIYSPLLLPPHCHTHHQQFLHTHVTISPLPSHHHHHHHHHHHLIYTRYAEILLNSVASPSPLVVSEEDLEEMEGKVAREWRWVAVFFMLRQALAPCVEKMLLLDRRLYLLEQGWLYWVNRFFNCLRVECSHGFILGT